MTVNSGLRKITVIFQTEYDFLGQPKKFCVPGHPEVVYAHMQSKQFSLNAETL